jgi:hypothetical protein
VRYVDLESGERRCENCGRRVRDACVDDGGGIGAHDEEEADVAVAERRDESVYARDDLAHTP